MNQQMDNQGIWVVQGEDKLDEEGNRTGSNKIEENEEEKLEDLSYEERVLRALEV